MTCVWDGLIKALGLKLSAKSFCIHIKTNNRETSDVKCNGIQLTLQQMKENMAHISAIKTDDINKGYYCSGCDPLFLLVGQLYCVSIDHLYRGARIFYQNKNAKNYIYSIK